MFFVDIFITIMWQHVEHVECYKNDKTIYDALVRGKRDIERSRLNLENIV